MLKEKVWLPLVRAKELFSRAPPSHLLPLTALPTYGTGMGVGTTVVPASAQAPPLAFLILGGEGG